MTPVPRAPDLRERLTDEVLSAAISAYSESPVPSREQCLAKVRDVLVSALAPLGEPEAETTGWQLLEQAPVLSPLEERPPDVLLAGRNGVFMGTVFRWPQKNGGALGGTVAFGNGTPMDWGLTHFRLLPSPPEAP